MRIAVALITGQLLEPELWCLKLPRAAVRRFVTFGTGGSYVCTSQLESCAFMACQCKRGRKIAPYGMTLLTAIDVGSSRKLRLVHVIMAIEALGKLDLEARVSASRDVAPCAVDIRMFSDERVKSRRVLFHPERRGFESVHVVAGLAAPAVRSFYKLITVGARFVTVSAILERNWFLEIAAGVALLATNFPVLSKQWVLCFGVIEPCAYIAE